MCKCRTGVSLVTLLVAFSPTLYATTFDTVASTEFDHALEFDVDGEIPSVEGAIDGWTEDAAWVIDGDTPPSLRVEGGLLHFNSVPAGQQSIVMATLSAWEQEILPETSYTFEVRIRMISSTGTNPGATIWLANGATRSILLVDNNRVGTFSGTELDTGDNTSDFVTIRVAYSAVAELYFVWRDGVLIGNGLPPDGAAAGGRTAVFLIDCCSTVQAEGELDYVRWDASGAYAPTDGGGGAPAAPGGLSAQPEDGRVLLDWDDSPEDDVACYNVFRSESSGGPYDLQGGEVFGSAYTDDAVENGTTYYYVVRALNFGGDQSAQSEEASATPNAGLDVTPPATPLGLMATALEDSIALDWDDNLEGDLGGYDVSRSEVAGGPYSVVAADLVASDYEDDSVSPLVRYYYIVTAKDLTGNSSIPTAEVTSIVTTGIGAGIERDSDTFPHALEFNDDGVPPSVEGADDGWVETGAWGVDVGIAPYFEISGGSAVFDTSGLGQGGGLFFDFQQPAGASAWSTEISPSTSYTFEVRLRVTGGVEGVENGGVTNPGASLWLANGADRCLVVVRTDQLRWGIDPGDIIHEGDNAGAFVTVRIAYDGPSGEYFVFRDRALVGSNLLPQAGDARRAMFLIDFGATSEAAGEFDYVRWDTSGAYFPPRDPNDTTPPATPDGLAAIPEDGRVLLEWDANNEPDLGSYRLQRSTTQGGPYDTITETGATSYADEGLENGTTYYYVLAAIDINRNESGNSEEASATPLESLDVTPPAAPTGLLARANLAGEVSLSWEFSPDIDADVYNLYRSEVGGGPYEPVAEGIPLLETNYLDDAVDLGTTYFYVLTVVDFAGNESDNSLEVSATPEIFEGFPERAASSFAHKLLMEDDGVLPSVEGAADGWTEDAAWTIGGDVPPTLSVADGVLYFNSILPGQQSISLGVGSAWETEITPATSYTFEITLKVLSSSAPNPGATIWLANGATRFILQVDVNQITTFSGVLLHEGDNSSDFVTIRIVYHSPTDLYYVWRDEEFIGEGLPAEGEAAGGRTAVFVIDCCSSVQAEGEIDTICWDSSGAFAPGSDTEPRFVRGNVNADDDTNLTDGIFLLNFLFLGGPSPTCQDASDSNNDNEVNLTDAVFLLNFLFLGGPPPPAPTGACGTDPDNDALSCAAFAPCP